MVQLSGKMLLRCTGYLCVFLFTEICYPNKKTLQHMDRICPKLPNPSDVKSMNVMTTLEKNLQFFGYVFIAFPPPFCVQSSFEIADRRPFVHLIFSKGKSPKKFDTENFFCCFRQTKKSPHQKTRVTGNEHVANVPLIFGK